SREAAEGSGSAGASPPPIARSGLTLLEVVIALAIFLFSLVAINQLVSHGSEQAMGVQQHAQASMACQSKMNEVISGSESRSSSGTVEFGKGDIKLVWNYTIESTDTGNDGLYNVKVTFRYDRPSGKSVEATLSQMVFDPSLRGSTLVNPT